MTCEVHLHAGTASGCAACEMNAVHYESRVDDPGACGVATSCDEYPACERLRVLVFRLRGRIGELEKVVAAYEQAARERSEGGE